MTKQVQISVCEVGAADQFVPATTLEPVCQSQAKGPVDGQQLAGGVESMFIVARQHQKPERIGVVRCRCGDQPDCAKSTRVGAGYVASELAFDLGLADEERLSRSCSVGEPGARPAPCCATA